MAFYQCVPSSQTVPPCPTGTAPNSEVVVSDSLPTRYPGKFDHIPVQDVLIGLALVFALLFGLSVGRRS